MPDHELAVLVAIAVLGTALSVAAVHFTGGSREARLAGTLIIWDRIFGTFVAELDEDRSRYRVVKNLGTFNPLKVAFTSGSACSGMRSRRV